MSLIFAPGLAQNLESCGSPVREAKDGIEAIAEV